MLVWSAGALRCASVTPSAWMGGETTWWWSVPLHFYGGLDLPLSMLP